MPAEGLTGAEAVLGAVVMTGAAATGALLCAWAAFELATTAPTPAAPMPSTTAPVATHVTILRFIVPLPRVRRSVLAGPASSAGLDWLSPLTMNGT